MDTFCIQANFYIFFKSLKFLRIEEPVAPHLDQKIAVIWQSSSTMHHTSYVPQHILYIMHHVSPIKNHASPFQMMLASYALCIVYLTSCVMYLSPCIMHQMIISDRRNCVWPLRWSVKNCQNSKEVLASVILKLLN